ncbi:hypothetical protein NIES2100_41060 [Calothrix sp. NIES-2100]|uniref:hypothetical protein n=1 Tax=Calothrix sp. NIES-2100 TaxID=1954172 RepID=UPI000B6221CA|nr:hypothetical protein NIES2100_41060 [Calothrix sp. NIES-2100]
MPTLLLTETLRERERLCRTGTSKTNAFCKVSPGIGGKGGSPVTSATYSPHGDGKEIFSGKWCLKSLQNLSSAPPFVAALRSPSGRTVLLSASSNNL